MAGRKGGRVSFPCDTTSELGVIGSVIEAQGNRWSSVERDMLTDAGAIILADAVDGLLADRQPVELATVARQCGDMALVGKAMESAAGGLDYHLGILREKRGLRALQSIASTTQSMVQSLDTERRSVAADIAEAGFRTIADTRAAMAAIAGSERRSPKDALKHVLDRLEAADRGEHPPCIKTEIHGVDALLDGGIQRYFMLTVGARSGVGKTALALWLTAAACRAGKSVLYGSRELPSAMIAHRLLCLESRTGIRLSDGTRGIPESKRPAVLTAHKRIAGWPLDIRDDISTVEQLIGAASRTNPDMLVVDHVGIFGVSQRKGASPFEDTTRKSNLLRDFSKDTGIPTIVLAQLNRAAVDAESPGLHHLKQSGALEEDSRVVLLLSVSDPEVARDTDRMEIDVAKNTIGRCGVVTVDFQKNTGRFDQYREPFDP
jgi:replicative DNA helicase